MDDSDYQGLGVSVQRFQVNLSRFPLTQSSFQMMQAKEVQSVLVEPCKSLLMDIKFCLMQLCGENCGVQEFILQSRRKDTAGRKD